MAKSVYNTSYKTVGVVNLATINNYDLCRSKYKQISYEERKCINIMIFLHFRLWIRMALRDPHKLEPCPREPAAIGLRICH